MLAITVWNEHRVDDWPAEARQHYPDGIHGALRAALAREGLQASTATLDADDHGLPPARLEGTDVLVWWGHRAHDEVPDLLVDRIQDRVLAGMGFVALHSAHFAKPFLRLMGTSGRLRWRHGEREQLWIIDPGHPIAQGLPGVIDLDEEMYGEPFDIPAPDELVAISSFAGGEVFRSVCTWHRGLGRVVYIRPGDEHHPTYHHPEIGLLLANAVRWAGGDG